MKIRTKKPKQLENAGLFWSKLDHVVAMFHELALYDMSDFIVTQPRSCAKTQTKSIHRSFPTPFFFSKSNCPWRWGGWLDNNFFLSITTELVKSMFVLTVRWWSGWRARTLLPSAPLGVSLSPCTKRRRAYSYLFHFSVCVCVLNDDSFHF